MLFYPILYDGVNNHILRVAKRVCSMTLVTGVRGWSPWHWCTELETACTYLILNCSLFIYSLCPYQCVDLHNIYIYIYIYIYEHGEIHISMIQDINGKFMTSSYFSFQRHDEMCHMLEYRHVKYSQTQRSSV